MGRRKEDIMRKNRLINVLVITDVLSILSVIAIFINSELCTGTIWLGIVIFLICYIMGMTFYLCISDSTIRKWIIYIIDLITWL